MVKGLSNRQIDDRLGLKFYTVTTPVLTNGTFGAGPEIFADTAATIPTGFYRIVSP